MPDILIRSIRVGGSTGALEVRGASPRECTPATLTVDVTVEGESQPSYSAVRYINTPAVNGYCEWAVFAQMTEAYATSTNLVDPPCDLAVVVTASQGTCATKPDPDPITLHCCAGIYALDATVSDCRPDRTRTVTVTFRVERHNEAGAIVVLATLRNASDDSGPPAQTFTLGEDEDQATFSHVFTVSTPAEGSSDGYECVVGRANDGPCTAGTRSSLRRAVDGCPCPTEPGELTIHSVSSPFAEIEETVRNGVACVSVALVRVHAPDYGGGELVWEGATSLGGRAASVDLPADGSDVVVTARLGRSPCEVVRTRVLRRCQNCPTIRELQFAESCQPDGRSLVTFSANVEPDESGTYTWNFGDGSPEETTSAPSATHFYGATGPFTVALTFTPGDAACGADAFQRAITLSACACPRVTAVRKTNEFCAASIEGVALGNGIAAFEATTDPPDSDGVFTWDFGDRSSTETTTVPVATHRYATGGTPTVKVSFAPALGRCASSSAEDTFTIQQCLITPPLIIDQCCLFLMIVAAMFMFAAAVLLPLALCVLFGGEIRTGIVLTVVALAIGIASFLLLGFWLLWCATLRVNCWLLDLVFDVVLFLLGLSAFAFVASLIADLIIAIIALAQTSVASYLRCAVPISGGLAFDTAYFGILALFLQWFRRFVGCAPYPPWVPPPLRITVPNWLTGMLNFLRGLLPPCPL
jgi:hypothetical protein